MMEKIKVIFWFLISIGAVGYFMYKVARNSFTDSFMGNSPQRSKAVIIDEKNYMGNQPVAARFSYSYQFIVDGKKYTGNSHDNSLQIGDTVEIEYNKDSPNINRPVYPKD